MQYSLYTVSITNGSNTVTGAPGTRFLTNVSPGNSFKIKGDPVIYQIASVTSDTVLTLSSSYAGTTVVNGQYQITTDFTPNFGFAEVNIGDQDWPVHLTVETIRKLDEVVAQLPAGYVYKGTWDANANVPAIPAASTENANWLYRVSTAGSTSLNGITTWGIGDSVISNGTLWTRLPSPETLAYTSATDAANSATAAATSATEAADSATAAATSATSSAGSATSASNSATAASTSASTASNKAAEVQAALIAFEATFLGRYAVDPTTDNQGNSILDGATYINTGTDKIRVYSAETSEWNDYDEAAQAATTSANLAAASAANSAGISTTKAGEAEVSAISAAESATVATVKAGEASQSADAATISAATALLSEQAAAGSAATANTKALEAVGSADIALTEAMAAEQSALAAAGSADTSITKAGEAANSALEAAASALLAQGYITDIQEVYWNGDKIVIGDVTGPSLTGPIGPSGVGITSITRTSGTGAPGTVDIYTILFTDATTTTFSVYNGTDGQGSGDMLKLVYDPDGDGVIDFAQLSGVAASLGTNDNYVTDSEKAALHSHSNKAALDVVSGINTGDQDLSGYTLTASLAAVATSGSYNDLSNTPVPYSLPTASTTVLGGVKVDGSSITITDGVIAAIKEGDVNGPTEAVANNFAAFDGTTGNIIKDSGVSVSSFEPANSNIQSHISAANNPHSVTAAQVGLGNVTNDAQVKRSEMGAASGVATLDELGKIHSTQLPSHVDDVLEFATLAEFPVTGESGKIYLAADTNVTYRWSGSTYAVIGSDLALGETSSTAYRGDRGKIAYDHSQVAHAPSDAEANVNADWNAVSGDAQILNKPTIPAAQVSSDWTASSGVTQILNKPTLGEMASQADVDTDGKQWVRKDKAWAEVVIPAGYSNEEAQDAVATALAAGTHTNISFSYDDTNNSISATVTSPTTISSFLLMGA